MRIDDIAKGPKLTEARKKRRGFRYPASVGYGVPSGSGANGGVGSDSTSGGVAEGNLKEFAPYSSRDDDGDSRDIDPLREKIYSLLMKKLANVKGNPQDIAMAAMEIADDIASESEFVDFTKLPKWVEMVLNKVQGMAEEQIAEDLRKWFKDKWVRFGPDGKIRGDCARGSDSEGKPKCLPQSKAHGLGKKGRASAARRKRREDPNPERRGKAKNVATKKKSAKKKVSEVLDNPYTFTMHAGDFGDYDFSAELDDGTMLHIEITREKSPESWSVQFHRDNTQDISGAGDAFRIFATVMAVIEQFIGMEEPRRISFLVEKIEADRDAASRIKLYNRLVQRYASNWGYDAKIQDSHNGRNVSYVLTRKSELAQGSLTEEYSWKIIDKVTKQVIGTYKTQEQAAEAMAEIKLKTPRKKDQYVAVGGQRKHRDLEESSSLTEVSAFHGTFRPRLSRFKALSHFGTYKSAEERLHQLKTTNPKFSDSDRGYIYELDLGIQNPGVVRDHPEMRDPSAVSMQKLAAWSKDLLRDDRIAAYAGTNPINGEQHKSGKDILKHFANLAQSGYWAESVPYTKFISLWINFLKSAGIDGLVYTNKVENVGSKSFVTFDPDQIQIKGKPKQIGLQAMTEQEVTEKWSAKYKRSINCNNPKGFSQRAHCQGKKKRTSESVSELTNIPFTQCPGCGGDIVPESQLHEKQDACYHKVKARYKVWPSAYASGALVQCRKKGAKNWGKKTEVTHMDQDHMITEGGNVFKTPDKTALTQRIATSAVPATIAFIEKITGLDFTRELDPEDQKPVKWLGTTGRKQSADGTWELNSSGDLDLSVDSGETTKEQLTAQLEKWCRAQGIPDTDIHNRGTKKTDGWIKDAGDSVHFRCPIQGDAKQGFVQADFMFSEDPGFQQGSMLGGSAKYRGEHRHIVLSSIARARGLKWSPKFGILNGDTNEPVPGGKDWNQIPKLLLGPSATRRDIRTVDSILDYIIKLPEYQDLVSAARETLGRQGIELPVRESLGEALTPGSAAWMRRMLNLMQ